MKIIIIILVILILNAFGFCYERMWFLSDRERIEIAVRKAFNFYENNASHGVTDFAFTGPELIQGEKYQQMPYKNIDDFFKENPNCCKVTREIKISEGELKVGIWGCLSGVSPYFVSGDFLVKVRVNDSLQPAYGRFQYHMSSCGTLYYLFD